MIWLELVADGLLKVPKAGLHPRNSSQRSFCWLQDSKHEIGTDLSQSPRISPYEAREGRGKIRNGGAGTKGSEAEGVDTRGRLAEWSKAPV